MKLILLFILIMTATIEPKLIYDFQASSQMEGWRIVDDGVMGGVSNGNFKIDENGHGEYYGKISLDNNGGFSSLRYRFSATSVEGFTSVKLTIKGDGEKFQFRVKESSSDYYSFVYEFETTGEWQEVAIPLAEMHPTFRGRVLNFPNFEGISIEEVAILRGNKKYEDFVIRLDKIELI